MAELYVKMLGSPSVQVDGQSVAFPYRKADALLYYLIFRKKEGGPERAGRPALGRLRLRLGAEKPAARHLYHPKGPGL